jgi:hypothetical protein
MELALLKRLGGGHVVGRILLHLQGPEGQPWFWSITAIDYSATREQAMADFRARPAATRFQFTNAISASKADTKCD